MRINSDNVYSIFFLPVYFFFLDIYFSYVMSPFFLNFCCWNNKLTNGPTNILNFIFEGCDITFHIHSSFQHKGMRTEYRLYGVMCRKREKQNAIECHNYSYLVFYGNVIFETSTPFHMTCARWLPPNTTSMRSFCTVHCDI